MQSWLHTVPALIAILVWKPEDVLSITCEFDVQGSGGFISSESSEDCYTASWLITAPLYHNIKLKFETFQLSDSQWLGQNRIYIYDGLYTKDTLLGVFTGARRPFIIQSSDRFMMVKLTKQMRSSTLSNFKGVYTFKTAKDKPKILVMDPVVRAAPGHFVWCSAEGSPPINISIFKCSTSLANGTGLVMAPLYETGIYSCVASNEAGSDKRDFSVTIVDCGNLCFNHGDIMDDQVENNVRCNGFNSSVDIFTCLPSTATNLNIKGMKMRYLPKEAFRHMTALKHLDIRNNEIEVLPEELFSDLFSLQVLFLSENNIQSLTENVFSPLVSLQHLNLASNKIEELQRGIFSNLSNLMELNLRSNKIEQLPTGIFSNLSKLTDLDLKENKVQNLRKTDFSALGNLQQLHLTKNKIQDLPENVFSALVNLETLYLTENNIHTLPENIFSALVELEFLYLTQNKIQDLPENIFSALVNLKILRLDSNKIQDLPAKIFFNQRDLLLLDCSSNQIQYLPRGVFSNTLGLKYLFLSKNFISTISNETFSNIAYVRYLLLNENHLQVIPDQAFKNLRGLKIIMLSDNPIKTIGSQAFAISPFGKLLIYMIRTDLKNVSLQSFDDTIILTPIISMDEGKIGILKLMGTDHTERCSIHLGLGQGDTDYLHIQRDLFGDKTILEAFAQAGFARKVQDVNKLHVLPCPPGTFVDSSVSDPVKLECLNCPAGGFYSDTKALVHDSCLKCPNGTFVPYDKTPGVRARDCIACPQGTDTNTFAGYRACKCLNGFHRTHRFEGCKPCDQDGLNCENDYATLKTGYWWKWKNETYKHLYDDFTMSLVSITYSPGKSINSPITYHSVIEFPHRLPTPHKCPREESCMGGLDSFCATGYQGPLCEVCSAGYYRQLHTCQLCPTKKWVIVQLSVMATVVVIVIAVLVWTGKKKSKNSERSSVDVILGRLKIVIGFYQVTNGVLEAFSYIKWPDSLTLIGKYSETLQLSVFQIAPIHCLLPNVKMNAFGNLFAILAMNSGAIFLSVLVYLLRKLLLLRGTLNKEQKEKKVAQTKELIYRNLFFFLYVTYLNTCLKTAQVLPLACRTLCLDEEKETCDVYLKADYNVKCEGQEYNSLVIVAYCAVFYIIILPTASLIALWRQQRKMPHGNEIHSENKALEPQDQATEIVTGLRFLFENYNSHSWYWELIETIRKVVLTSGLILVGGESRAYVGLACVLSGLYGMLFAYKSPIVDPFENKLMLTSLAVTFINLGIGAVSKIPKERIPASIDPYVDGIMFNILVIGANSLVIGLLAVQYLVYIYCYIKEWRKNPKWSFSCCLAMVLPLTELQGEIRGLAGRNMLKQQLTTGRIDMPSMSSTLKDSGLVTIDLAEDETNLTPRTSDKMTDTRNKENKEDAIWEETSTVDIHKQSRNVEDTFL